MRDKLTAYVLFCSIFVLRWLTYPSPLPQGWTPQDKVRYTARIIEQPAQIGSKTVIKQGRWRISLRGYQGLKPGEIYSFAGKVTPRVLGGKIVEIKMMDPTFEINHKTSQVRENLVEVVIIQVARLRQFLVERLQSLLPEPQASLSAGILLGVSSGLPDKFYDQLVTTGTLHIVAASGTNVAMVLVVIMLLLAPLPKVLQLIVGVMAIICYVLLAGAGPSIVRAGIMGGLAVLAKSWGRPSEAKRLLFVTGAIMLLVDPLLIASAGFWLSFCATAGILWIAPWLDERTPDKLRPVKEYVVPTLAATVATLPVTWLFFGQVSMLGPVVNLLILPVVPLIMLLTALTLVLPPLAPVLYVPLEWMVLVVRWWG